MTPIPMMKKVAVVQFSGRNKFLVARICERHGLLKELHTDLWLGRPWRRAAAWGNPLFNLGRRLANRFSEEIPDDRVTSYPSIGLSYVFHRNARRLTSYSAQDEMRVELRYTKKFQEAAARRLASFDGTVYSIREAREVFESTRAFKIMEEVNALGVYQQQLQKEMNRWPGWESSDSVVSQDLWDELLKRERDSYNMADRIVAPSAWVRDYLAGLGVPESKITVIPYWCPPRRREAPKTFDGRRKLRVLFAGRVTLVKGIQYLAEAARLLREEIEVTAVGKSFLSSEAMRSVQDCVRIYSHMPYADLERLYDWADVFVMPTVCEGSALVVYLALSHGLPVVTTHNCGSLVENGLEGFIISPHDAVSLVDSLRAFLEDPSLIQRYSESAMRKSDQFGLETYTTNILGLFSS